MYVMICLDIIVLILEVVIPCCTDNYMKCDGFLYIGVLYTLFILYVFIMT